MRSENPIWLVLILVVLAALGYFVIKGIFSDRSRLERRRHRNNRRLVNTSKQPMVKLSVRSKDKRK